MSKFKPMKAADILDFKSLHYPLIASVKLDGVYAVVKDGQLLGRSLKPFKNKFITEQLSKPEYEGFCGELCEVETDASLGRQDLCRNTTSCVNTIDRQWKYVWVLFDYIHPDAIDRPYFYRMEALGNKLYELMIDEDLDPIRCCMRSYVRDPSQAKRDYEYYLSKGYEGLILRDPMGKWKNGRSTLKEQGFLRCKPQDFSEAVIIGVCEAMENQNIAKINELGYTERSSHQENKVGKGIVGSFEAIDLASGEPIKVGAGKLTHEERVHYWDNPPMGEITKYKSMTYGIKSDPRFARHYSFRAAEDLDDVLFEKYGKVIKELEGMINAD